jgi:hypothetical protein
MPRACSLHPRRQKAPEQQEAAVNQASMFFTALLMLAGAGWYAMASNPDMAASYMAANDMVPGAPGPAIAQAQVGTPAKAPLVARAPAPIAAKASPPEQPPLAR